MGSSDIAVVFWAAAREYPGRQKAPRSAGTQTNAIARKHRYFGDCMRKRVVSFLMLVAQTRAQALEQPAIYYQKASK
jgi:hypothetical protein